MSIAQKAHEETLLPDEQSIAAQASRQLATETQREGHGVSGTWEQEAEPTGAQRVARGAAKALTFDPGRWLLGKITGKNYAPSQFERSAYGATEGILGSAIGTVSAMQKGAARANRPLVKAGATAGPRGDDVAMPEQPKPLIDPDKLNQWAQEIWQDSQRQELRPAPGSGPWSYVQHVTGQTLPFMASAMAATAVGGPLAGFAAGAGVEGDNAYREARASGANESQAQTERLIVGTVNGIIETMQVGRLLKGSKPAVRELANRATQKTWARMAKAGGKLAAKDLENAVVEGIQEATQEAVGVGAATIHGDAIDLADIKQIGEAGVGGFTAGAILGVPGSIVGAGHKQTQGPSAAQAVTETLPPDGITPESTVEAAGGLKPQIAGVALLLDDGTIIKGPGKSGHIEIVDQLPPDRNVVDAGFLDADGNYLNRDDVLSTPEQRAARQTSPDVVAKETPQAQAETAAKETVEPWQMTRKEYQTTVRNRKGVRAAFKIGDEVIPTGAIHDWNKVTPEQVQRSRQQGVKSGFVDESGAFFTDTESDISRGQHTRLVEQAVKEGKPVPAKALEEYAVTADWAKEALVKANEAQGATPGEARVTLPVKEETQAPALANLSQAAVKPPIQGVVSDKDFGRAVLDIVDTVKRVKRLAPDIRAQQRQSRAQRTAMAAGTLQSARQQGAGGQEALSRSMAKLGGAQAQYENLYPSVRDQLTPEQLDAVYTKLADDPKVRYYEKLDLMRSFDGLVDGRALTLRQASIMERYFGPEMADVAKSHVPFGERMWNLAGEVANIPRTTMASFDMSGILRQGRVLGGEHPVLYAKMVKRYGQAFYSEKGAKRIEAEYTESPRFQEAQDAGLDLTEWGRQAGQVGQQEERFQAARLLNWLPGVRASERSFSVSLNWLRFGVYDKVVSQAETAGNPLTAKQKEDLASAINDMSGRSAIKSQAVQRIAPILNAVFFSPRFARSRFRTLENVATGAARSVKSGHIDPAWKETLGGLASLIGTNLAIMGLLKLTDSDDDIELNPDLRSADGGKIKIGNQRIDLWAGMLQPARLMVRLATGQTINADGKAVSVPRRDVAMQFLQSKESPIASLMHGLLTGESFLGEPVGAPPSGAVGEKLSAAGVPETVQGVGRELYNRLTPMLAQDTVDALMIEGIPQAVTALSLGFFGAGVQTYEASDYAKSRMVKNEWAKDKYGKAWEDLSMAQQVTLRNETPAIDQTERLAKAKPAGENPYASKQENETARRIAKSLPDDIRKQLETANIGTGISRTIGKDFRLNDDRYKLYEQKVTEGLQQELPSLFKSPSWETMPQASRDKVLKQRVTAVKKRAREQLMAEINRESAVRG